jgi:hypothetical protein
MQALHFLLVVSNALNSYFRLMMGLLQLQHVET